MILFLIWLYSLDIARWFLSSLNIIWTINKKPNTVYLTIDDVVNPDSFEEILDVLDKFNVKATFFVISSYVTESNKKLLTRSVKSGHRLANHGQRNKMHALYSDIKLLEEIEECDNLIKQIYLENNIEIPKEKFFRPDGHCTYPFGKGNAISVTGRQTRIANEREKSLLDFSIKIGYAPTEAEFRSERINILLD